MEIFKVDFYKKEDGTKPVGQFIRGLDVKMKAKVVANMHLLEEYGNMTGGAVIQRIRRRDYYARKEAGTYE